MHGMSSVLPLHDDFYMHSLSTGADSWFYSDCIHPNKSEGDFEKVVQLYIDPDTCIDCGACIPECPFEAIFPEEEVPSAYTAKGAEYISKVGLTGHYDGENTRKEPVSIDTVRQLEAGEVVDLTEDIKPNYAFFKEGPGYSAK